MSKMGKRWMHLGDVGAGARMKLVVNMIMTEESWYVVRNTPGVTGFVGMGNTPTPLRTEEVSQIIKRMEADAPRIKVTFKSGERVRICLQKLPSRMK